MGSAKMEHVGKFSSPVRKFSSSIFFVFLVSDPTSENLVWREGRRIVQLGVLAEHLEHCTGCSQHLHLADCVEETQQGLGSLLHIPCRWCRYDNIIPTGTRHGDHKRIWDVNSKIAAGMYITL